MKMLSWFFFVISASGVVAGIVAILYGSQPCSGDGCLIHIFQIIGIILLAVFGPIAGLTGYKLGLWAKKRRS